MKEIVIISGKGGTGKTSITASFAALAANNVVIADCDVDAADLHLVTSPTIRQQSAFISGHKAVVRADRCTGCGICSTVCRFDALQTVEITTSLQVKMKVNPLSCEGCGVCVAACSEKAIDFPDETCGEWYISDTRFGTMVHARLGIAAENSGKLVTLLRREAKELAERELVEFLLIDGSPGTGCPVIASLTASDLALIVTEPTVSGVHDLKRILSLTRKLGVPVMVCINKWDINPDVTQTIEAYLDEHGIGCAGHVRYDTLVTTAQRQKKTIVELSSTGCAEDIELVWKCVVGYCRV